MNFNAILSLLVHKGIISFDEGEKLSKELVSSVVDTNFKTAHKDVSYLLDKIKPKKAIAKKTEA
jgi:hypothetical protein